MDMIEAVHTYYYNPFRYGRHLVSFFNYLEEVDQNLLLLPLIIPICTHPELSIKLNRIIINGDKISTFYTKFDNPKEFYDLHERIDALRELSIQSLSYCMINDWINVEQSSLNIITNMKNYNAELDKQASNLGKLFSGLSTAEIYKGLRVNP